MLVSALVSAYYAEKFLPGRIENLLAQSLRPEIIVVCQSGSREEAIAASYPECRIITTPDIPTIYAAWNTAASASEGEFLTNANCDDRFMPRGLEEMVRQLQRAPRYAVCYGDQDIVQQIDGPVVDHYRWAEGGYRELLKGCFIGPMPVWRRSLHDKYGWFDPELRVAGDYEFWLRIAAGGERFLHLRAVVGTYLNRTDSAEHRQALRAVWETARVRAKYAEVKR